jgi:hypothetical protein
MPTVITLDWGARSEQLRALHAALGGKKSFLLVNAATPVALGTLTASQTTSWDTANVSALTVTWVSGTYKATVTVPGGVSHVRLDFDLSVTIGANTASCLEFRQLFAVGANGVLMPSQYSFHDHVFLAGSGPGATSPIPVRPPRRRTVLGACPLLSVTATSVTVNCEFLDVTELWWATWAAADVWGWYLDPDFHGRPDLLRVLAWTSGTAPMLWFVALSDKAADEAKTSPRPGADIIFFRAQAGFNSFRYSSDEKGFLADKHRDTTMFHLGRWLLSPLTEPETVAKLAKTGTAAKPLGVKYAGIRLRPNTPPPAIVPKDPMDAVHSDVRLAFRPSCVHDALDHSPSPDVAFFPLGFDGGGASDPYTRGGGYTALLRAGALREVLSSARALLWIRGALSRAETATPVFDRQIWLLANSAANRQLFNCLIANAADIDRIISLDATKFAEVLIPMGIPAIQAASVAPRKAGKTFKAVIVTTPNMWSGKTAYLEIEKKLLATKADVVMLPPTPEFDAYWQYPPTATSNPLLLEALRFWDGSGLLASRRFGTIRGPDGSGSQWLFWHEWSVDGGHLDPPPSGAASGSPPRVRTFFEDALRL